MRILPLAIIAAAAMLTTPAYAADKCKDAKGKFIKCPVTVPTPKATPKAKPTPAVKATPIVKPAPTPVAKGTPVPTANGKGCTDSVTHKFTKCTAAATPAAPTDPVKKDATGKCHWAAGPKKGKFAPQALCK